MLPLSREQRRSLLVLLGRLPNIQDLAARRLLLAGLPGALQAGLPLGNAPAIDLANLVGTVTGEAWATLPDGTASVGVVVENAIDMVPGSGLAGELQAWLRSVETRPSGTAAGPGAPPPTATTRNGGISFYGATTITGQVVGGDVQNLTVGDLHAPGGSLGSSASAPPPPPAPRATPLASTPAPAPADGAPAGAGFRYDAFISYSSKDRPWVKTTLLPRLEREGLRVCIDYRDFEIGVPSLVNIENAVEGSRKTLLVITQAWLDSQWTDFESLLVQTDDPAARRRRILPLRLADVALPGRLRILTYLDLSDPNDIDTQLERLVGAIRAAPA